MLVESRYVASNSRHPKGCAAAPLPLMSSTLDALSGFALALGCGLLIGVERERRKGTGLQRQYAGVRSFTLVALLGAGAQYLAQPLVMLAAALLVVGLSMVSYWRDRSDDPGVTTEIALFVTFVLGAMALQRATVAAAGAVVVASLLAARLSLQRFSTHILTEREFRGALVLAAAALIVLPLTPNQPLPWLGGVNPYTVWQLVVLLMLLQSASHIALRVFGTRLGLPLAGLTSGFVSSTATMAAMGRLAREHSTLRMACVSGALFSTVATPLQMLLIAVLMAPQLVLALAPSLGCALAASAVLGGLALWRSGAPPQALPERSAFSLWQSVGLALMLTSATALVAWAQAAYGPAAIYMSAALAGFADAHAGAVAVINLVASDPTQRQALVPAVLLSMSANSVGKMVMAFVGGGWRFGAITASGLVVVALVMWLPWYLRGA